MTQDKERAPGRAPEATGTGDAVREAQLRRLLALRARRIRANQRADAYNRAHAAACAEFNQLTGGDCGVGGEVDVPAVRAWQRQHRLVSDGRVSGATLAAARACHGGPKPGRAPERGVVTFADDESDAIALAARALPSAEEAVADGAHDGLETRAPEPPDAAADQSRAHAAGLHESLAHGIEGADGPHLGAVGRLALATVLVPALVELLRARRYRDAIAFVVDSVSLEERLELLHHALAALARAAGYRLAPHVVALLEHAALAGAVLDVLALGWEWTAAGLEAVQRAHEHGDRDSRIAIYAWAWADTVLGTRHSNPGAVTPDEREAMARGVSDGEATRAAQPDLGALLIAQYGDAHNARLALEDALLARAGLAVRAHVGR